MKLYVYIVITWLGLLNARDLSAYTCYVCTGTTPDDDCALHRSVASSWNICGSCSKIDINGVVSRNCNLFENARGDYCYSSKGVTTCSCDSDLCNVAGLSTVSVGAIAVTLAIASVML
ncbi:hypothetical protein DPMN_107128 [Dreissena polymorpha]|uniref:Protein quiver n=1 Tax=Dreissena polymorpha TaxID=45954 RepID=A0A9D4K660_DREPO|nr:hypothetical protein DPMN_107128 [Dreissena polymorpha]